MTFKTKLLAGLITVLVAGAAQAGLVAHADVNGLSTFQDTNTGRVWLQIPELFGMDYISQRTAALNAGFTVASFADVDALWDSAPTNPSWSSMKAVIGDSNSRELIWGNFATAGAPAWAWAYESSAVGQWQTGGGASGQAYSDLGLWAYQTGAAANVPEPASYALVIAALAGVGLTRRRRQA